MLGENIDNTLLLFCLLVPHGITGLAKTQGRITEIYGKELTVVHSDSFHRKTYRQAIQHAGPTFTFPSTCKFSTYPPKRFETNPRFPTSVFFTLKFFFFLPEGERTSLSCRHLFLMMFTSADGVTEKIAF